MIYILDLMISLQECSNCSEVFTCNEKKHHCRACGKGVCSACSSKERLVPERGWGSKPVRVCDKCFAGNLEGMHKAYIWPFTVSMYLEVSPFICSRFARMSGVIICDYDPGVCKSLFISHFTRSGSSHLFFSHSASSS